MKHIDTKHKLAVLAVFMMCFNSAQASESMVLKVSTSLGYQGMAWGNSLKKSSKSSELLGKVQLFRGVAVDAGANEVSLGKLSKSDLKVTDNKPRSLVNAIYGGLQLSFKDNLSLIYAPGRLSGSTLNSASQGLYLLGNRGGAVNWFLGVESRAYSNASDTRRSANTAQFGVLLDLD